MSVMVGGTGIIGQDMVCGFGKKIIVFEKWESAAWHWQTGKAETTEEYIRTPLEYKKKVKPNTKYEFISSEPARLGFRMYRKDGVYLRFADISSSYGFFSTVSETSYLLITVPSEYTNLKVTIKEVS